jgi:DnaJ-class molecular chaperone
MTTGNSGGGEPTSNIAASGMAVGKEVPQGMMAGDQTATGQRENMNPGDEVPAGTPSSGETICFDCNGSGQKDGSSCAACGGSGKIIESVAGGP